MRSKPIQGLQNLQGEVEFRKKLAIQHVTGEVLIPGYYSKAEHDQLLQQRIDETVKHLQQLVDQRITLSPFIELGAERGQRSLVLANDFDAQGFAVDISFHQLKAADHFAKQFGKPKLPYRVCCDVNHLPFRSYAFPFVCCYQFLHHFPDLLPVIEPIYRILANGHFFFANEPFKTPRLNLYERASRVSSPLWRRAWLMQLVERFISEEACVERDYGIIERDDISLQDWLKALALFDAKTLHLSSLQQHVISKLGDRPTWRNLPNLLLGGEISGICQKRSLQPTPLDLLDAANDATTLHLNSFLICPNCAANDPTVGDRPTTLTQTADHLKCSICDSKYPFVEGVLMLLPTPLLTALYPQIAEANFKAS